MKGGDVNEFINHMCYGDELIFLHKIYRYFIQGWCENNEYILCLDRWVSPANDYIWIHKSKNGKYPIQEFLDAKIFDGKTFQDIENELEWVDD